jgi:hypothetical protein
MLLHKTNIELRGRGKKASGADNQQGSPLSDPKRVGYDPSETIRQMPRMTRDLAILLGLLFTDGCVSPKGRSSWRIFFANKSQSLIDLFRRSILRAFSLEPHQVRIGKTPDGYFKAVVDSKDVGDYLTINFGTFRTRRFRDGKWPNARLPVEELLESGFANIFLKTAFSCDGGLCFYPAYRKGSRGGSKWLIRNILLSCAHPKLRRDFIVLLKSLKIEAKEIPKEGKIRIQRENSIKRFYREVGFVRGVKATNASKFWSGCEKQYILELMVSSYGNPSKIYNLSRFHSR